MSDERQSECWACPPYVIRCAHLDGIVVDLVEIQAAKPCPACGAQNTPSKFFVNKYPLTAKSSCVGCGQPVLTYTDLERSVFDDEPSALTEFQDRAAALLGRGA